MAKSGARWTPGKDAKKAFRTSSARGVALAAEHVLGEARRIVPIEESTLEKSGAASAEQTSQGVRGAISFDTPYLRGRPARRPDLRARRGQIRQVLGEASEFKPRQSRRDRREDTPRGAMRVALGVPL